MLKRTASVLFVLFLVGTCGCDQIPLLSKYFPSLGKSKESKIPKPAQTSTKVVMGPNTLARVGNWTITKEKFEGKLSDLKSLIPELESDSLESKGLILEELIRQELLVQDAEKRGLAKKREVVEAVEEFRRTLLVQEIVSDLTKEIEVTDLEAREFYESNKDSFSDPAQWRIREIVTSTHAEANDILIAILQGTDFTSMAKERSISESARNSGDLGLLGEEDIKFTQMLNAIKSLEVGRTSNIFRGPQGYYIIKLEEKRGGDLQEFSKVSEEIKAGLSLMLQQQAVLNYIDELKRKTTVEINEDLL